MKYAPRFALVLTASILCIVSTAHSFGSGDDRGTTGFKGLQMISDARTWGLGRATVALWQNPLAYSANPATAAGFRRKEVVLSATSYVMDVLPVGGHFIYPAGNGVWTFAVNALDYGDFDSADGSANVDGTFSAGDFMAHVAWARTFGAGFSGGVSVGWIRSTISDWSASALVLNLGVLWRSPDESTAIGLSATNMGTALSSYIGGDHGMKDSVPSALHLGASHRPEHFPIPLTLLTEIVLPRDNEATLNVAAEIRPADILSLRVGYNALVRYQSLTDSEGITQKKLVLDDRDSSAFGGLGLNFGIGVLWRTYGADYGYTMAGSFGGIHNITLRFLL